MGTEISGGRKEVDYKGAQASLLGVREIFYISNVMVVGKLYIFVKTN